MNYKRLVISLAIPQLAGLAGAFFTGSAITTWYAGLQKPSFSPPNWVFGPIWILLYLLMGVSIYLIWQRYSGNKYLSIKALGREGAKGAFWIFWIHLVFNAAWTPVFFGLKNPGLALADIIVIWLLVIVLIGKFWKLDKRASLLMVPYFVWVSFAGALNYFLWYLN